MKQCNQKLKLQAVMTIFGKSLTSGDLCVHFFNIFWNHFHSWNTLWTLLCSSYPFRTYCISQGMVRVCPFAIFLIAPWLEIDPSANEQFWLNEQFGPNAERFTEVWALTYFCMATCSLLAFRRSLEANFQQYFCWVVDFMFQQVVLQVRRELQRSSVVRALHDWFCTFGNCHIVRTLQTGSVSSQCSQTPKQLGINGDSCQSTDSGSIAILGLYRTICEWGTIHSVVLLRAWFDFHSTCGQFVRPDSGRFLAQLRLRCGSFLPMLGYFAGTFFPFSIYSGQYCGQSYLHGLWLSPLLHFHTTTGRTALQLTTLGVFMLHELPASRWCKPRTRLSRRYRRVLWTWRRFICKQQHFDVMAGASSLFSDQFICHLGTSKVVEIFATSNCHGGS